MSPSSAPNPANDVHAAATGRPDTNGAGTPRRRTPVVLYVPGLLPSTQDTAPRIAELVAETATREAGTFALEELRPPGGPLRDGRRVKSVDSGEVIAEIYAVDYRPRLDAPRDAGTGRRAAVGRVLSAGLHLLRTLVIVLSAIGRTDRGAKGRRAKAQLGAGFLAVGATAAAFVLAVVSALFAFGVWTTPDGMGTGFPQLTALGFTGIAAFLLARLGPQLADTSASVRQLMEIAGDDTAAASGANAVEEAVDAVLEADPQAEVHVLGYGVGALLGMEFLFPRAALQPQPSTRRAAVRTFATLGCPADLLRLYYRGYLAGRLPRPEPVFWRNVFIAADVLGSNFADGDDRSTVATMTDVAPTESVRYTSEDLTFSGILSRRGFHAHTGYWGEPGRAHCLHLVTGDAFWSRGRAAPAPDATVPDAAPAPSPAR